MMRRRAIASAKRALRHMRPSHLLSVYKTRGIMQKFAERVGLVYFGSVSAGEEDAKLVRGHTVSSTHVDNHYCVGSIKGYDLTLLTRNDVVCTAGPNACELRCHWIIVSVKLHATTDIPHMYVGHTQREQVFAATRGRLKQLLPGAVHHYPAQFLGNYQLHGLMADAVLIERLITPQMAEVVASHFQTASFEVSDNTLYVYLENDQPSDSVLEKLLANALWLAESLDARVTELSNPEV